MPIELKNPADHCIRVGGEEIQSDRGFQCEDCGESNDAETPILRGIGGGFSRKCSACGTKYRVHPWTEEA